MTHARRAGELNSLAAMRTLRRLAIVAIAFASLAVMLAAAFAAKPTVVLVHGAFADASGWGGVIDRLERRGYPVIAPANPLRGVSADAAYLRAFLGTIEGPIVLVGHSYGGVVITNAATGNANVKALVYVAAYAPDSGRHRPVARHARHRRPARPGDARPAAVSRRPRAAPAWRAPSSSTCSARSSPPTSRASTPATMALSQRPASLVTLGEPPASRPGRRSRGGT